jgi:hypothetical protein
MKRYVLAFAAAFLITSGAHAQDGSEQTATRTPEGANKFLAEFLPSSGGLLRSLMVAPNLYRSKSSSRWRGWRFPTPNDPLSSPWVDVRARVVGVSASDPCITVLSLTDFLSGGEQQFDDPTTAISPAGEVRTLAIDWKDVSAIYLYEGDGPSTLQITRKDNKVAPGFSFPRGEAGKRVKFAIEFLRVACVPKSTTGF